MLGRRHLPELRMSTMRDFFEIVPPEWVLGFNKVELLVKFRNGSEVYFRPFDDPSSCRGPTLGFVAVDEMSEVREESVQFLRARLRLAHVTGHKLFGCTNPGGRTHWLYRAYVDPTTRGHDNAYYQASSLENIFTPIEYRLDLLRAYDGQFLQRFVHGEWVDWEGRVWPSFADETNMLDAERIFLPPEMPRELAIDFGYQHAFACLWLAWDYRVTPPRVIVYDEYIARQRTLAEHAAEIHQRRLREPRPFIGYRTAWADHEAQERHELANVAVREHRIVTAPARKAAGNRRLALAAVEAAFRPRADGVPGILFTTRVPQTREAVLGYRRPERIPPDDPDAVIETNSKGESIDDPCDALWMGFWSVIGNRFESEPNYQPGMDATQRERLYRGWRQH